MRNLKPHTLKSAGWLGRHESRHCTSWELAPLPQPRFGSADPVEAGIRRRVAAAVPAGGNRKKFYERLKSLIDAARRPHV